MRHLLPALALLAASLALPGAAHADTLDDFVLTGGGHTYAFAFPATGLVYAGDIGISNLHGTTNFSTADGVPSGPASGSFFFEPQDFGTVNLYVGFVHFGDFNWLYGPALFGYDPTSLSGYPDGPYQAYFYTGTFDLGTFTTVNGQSYYTPYTLTIAPESSSTATPEPASLALLATGALGLLTGLRRRLV